MCWTYLYHYCLLQGYAYYDDTMPGWLIMMRLNAADADSGI